MIRLLVEDNDWNQNLKYIKFGSYKKYWNQNLKFKIS